MISDRNTVICICGYKYVRTRSGELGMSHAWWYVKSWKANKRGNGDSAVFRSAFDRFKCSVPTFIMKPFPQVIKTQCTAKICFHCVGFLQRHLVKDCSLQRGSKSKLLCNCRDVKLIVNKIATFGHLESWFGKFSRLEHNLTTGCRMLKWVISYKVTINTTIIFTHVMMYF